MGLSKIQKINAIPWLDCACLLALLWFAIQPNVNVEPELKHVLDMFKSLGLFAVLGVPILTIFIDTMIWLNPLSLGSLLRQWIRGYTAYVGVLWFMENQVNAWIINGDSTMVILSLAIALLIATFSLAPKHGPTSVALHGPKPLGQIFTRTLTEIDHLTISVHEASHAVMYGALVNKPDYLYATVEPQGETLGHVSGIKREDALPTTEFAYWTMLLYLAGQQGEATLLGKKTLSGTSDLERWTLEAHTYLANHLYGVYFPHPRTKWEHQSNERKLETLKLEQQAVLHLFFKINTTVTLELAAALREKKTLQRSDILPYLDRLTFPSGMPHRIKNKELW